MKFGELDETGRNFLLGIYKQTKGDPAAVVSMYAVGSELGLDRSTASHLAEDLMGWMLLEVRSLSGGVGITPLALEEIEASGFSESGARENPTCLGSEAVITGEVRQTVERVIAALKQRLGGSGLSYDGLAEVMADVKTIEAQLDSPRPKTAIVRAGLDSLKAAFAAAGARECTGLVSGLLGE